MSIEEEKKKEANKQTKIKKQSNKEEKRRTLHLQRLLGYWVNN